MVVLYIYAPPRNMSAYFAPNTDDVPILDFIAEYLEYVNVDKYWQCIGGCVSRDDAIDKINRFKMLFEYGYPNKYHAYITQYTTISMIRCGGVSVAASAYLGIFADFINKYAAIFKSSRSTATSRNDPYGAIPRVYDIADNYRDLYGTTQSWDDDFTDDLIYNASARPKHRRSVSPEIIRAAPSQNLANYDVCGQRRNGVLRINGAGPVAASPLPLKRSNRETDHFGDLYPPEDLYEGLKRVKNAAKLD
jgi:hypothetical protein